MRILAFISVTISSFLSFIMESSANESIESQYNTVVGLEFSSALFVPVECELDLAKAGTSIERVESFLLSMDIDYKIKGFDGEKVTIQLPLKDQIVLSTQILAK